jgi:hypothetical protein
MRWIESLVSSVRASDWSTCRNSSQTIVSPGSLNSRSLSWCWSQTKGVACCMPTHTSILVACLRVLLAWSVDPLWPVVLRFAVTGWRGSRLLWLSAGHRHTIGTPLFVAEGLLEGQGEIDWGFGGVRIARGNCSCCCLRTASWRTHHQ